jgi:hypothetical protein
VLHPKSKQKRNLFARHPSLGWMSFISSVRSLTTMLIIFENNSSRCSESNLLSFRHSSVVNDNVTPRA